MSHENKQPSPLAAIERTLAGFAPTPPRINRDRLMFLAGQANALATGCGQPPMDSTFRQDGPGRLTLPTRASGLWPASTATLAATSLALALALIFRGSPQPTIVYQDRSVATQAVVANQPSELVPANHSVAVTASSDRDQRETNGSYLKTREVALRMGLDALGSPPRSATQVGPTSYRDLWIGLTSASSPPSDKPEKQTSL